MVQPYKPSGAQKNKATAVKVTRGPGTTQQIGIDNAVILGMRAVVGSQKNRSTVQPF